MIEALKTIFETFDGVYTEIRLSFSTDGNSCAVFTDGMFNRTVELETT